MTKPVPITADIDAETFGILARAAGRRGISSPQFAAEAIRRVAESDEDFDAFLQVGRDAIARGDVIPHDEVMAELDRMIDRHRAR